MTQPLSVHSRAGTHSRHGPHASLEPILRNERIPLREKPVHTTREQPRLTTTREAALSKESQHSQKEISK